MSRKRSYNYYNELLYILVFVAVTIVCKSHLNNLFFDIFANIIFVIISIWYAGNKTIFTFNNFFVQIINGLWSSFFALFIILFFYRLLFSLHGKLVFNKAIRWEYIIFQVLVAVAEELVFRECFYKILSNMKIHIIFIIIFIAFLFGFWHYYLHYSYTQFVSGFIFSFFVLVFKMKIRNYTLLSCIITHFSYNILCFYLLFS